MIEEASEFQRHAALNGPEASLPSNPYHAPITSFIAKLKAIRWEFPFIAQVIESIVYLIIVVLLAPLFLTVGIASQISQVLWRLIEEAQIHVKESTTIEKSAYAIATAVYFILFFPFWIVQLPFWFIGWIWEKAAPAVSVAIRNVWRKNG
ncbi:MAG: hypothetical protein NTX50_17735 [Candidatus Sumerlaeota bacterium]|nr:hypothetical protein [Candidatus Sumerlaeota bacterium]